VFEWFNPFRRFDQRGEEHAVQIEAAQEAAVRRREIAQTQTKQLLIALQDFRDHRKDAGHELE